MRHRARDFTDPYRRPTVTQQAANMPQPTRPLMGGLSRIDPRHQLESRVALRFEDVERRVSGQALNISARGMFIRSREARPAGSPLAFELSLGGCEHTIHGEAEVVWMRRFELAADRPAGMGIRFLDLDQESDRSLRSFLAERIDPGDRRRGEAPADDAGWKASAYLNPLSGLSSSEQHKLYAFAGYASAGPERPWNRRLRSALSSVRSTLLGRG